MKPVHLKPGDITVTINLFKPTAPFFLYEASLVTLVSIKHTLGDLSS